jgi:hypothetical protein
MTLSEYRKTLSWQGAIELGSGLVRLAEEMPGSEEMGLSFQLRNIMVELPSAVAADLLRGTETRHKSLLKLLTVLELVDRVYPALDTAATRAAADRLAERLTGSAFQDELSPAAPESTPEPYREPVGEPSSVPVVEGSPAAPAPVLATPTPAPMPAPAPLSEPAPEPTHVAVVPAAEAAPAPVEPAAAPPEEQHVHPDSV